jgi:pimeloyl-ACP methyl ester carboxylesterase
MPYSTNPIDGVRTYYEDDGGDGPPVLVYSGITQSVADSRAWGLAEALRRHARLVFADHRGHGRSDRPHDSKSYADNLCAADFAGVLDHLGLEQAHFVGYSWAAGSVTALGSTKQAE